MNKLTCIIVDDQEKAREMLAMYLADLFPEIEIVAKFDHPSKAAHFLNETQVSLAFLDVEMGDVTGFDLFKDLKDKNQLPLFIFVTAHSGYAIEAIKADAFDYVLKPINPEELEKVVRKASHRIEEIIFQQRIQQTFFNQSSDLDQIQVLVAGGVEFVKKSNIIYLKASRNYTEIYLKGGRQILASKPLTFFESAIESLLFVRSHRSYLVNISEIRAFRTAEGGYLELTENHRANITAANKDILLKRMAEL